MKLHYVRFVSFRLDRQRTSQESDADNSDFKYSLHYRLIRLPHTHSMTVRRIIAHFFCKNSAVIGEFKLIKDLRRLVEPIFTNCGGSNQIG